jgi:glycosyltransferase involved in cell wall biosynthesis
MNVAFYAPMKPPDHDVPSGDRAIARALIAALRACTHDVHLASRLRTFDRQGEADVQARHADEGTREAARLVAAYAARPPDLWLTYHLHHKAPDFVGPRVTRALGIPYVVVEASIAPAQANGHWALGYEAAYDAIRGADAVVCVNPADVREVRNARPPAAHAFPLVPFIDTRAFPPRADARSSGPPRIATVAMMRAGAKLASYRLMAAALTSLGDVAFEVVLVGDGAARAEVAALFAPLGQRVSFAGALDAAGVAATLRACDLFAWPAIDEAIGISLLEAQACGLPAVAGASPGVAGVVADRRTGFLTPMHDAVAFAAAIRALVLDPRSCAAMGAHASAHVRAHHDLRAGGARLDAILREVVSARRRPAPPPHPPGLAAALP